MQSESPKSKAKSPKPEARNVDSSAFEALNSLTLLSRLGCRVQTQMITKTIVGAPSNNYSIMGGKSVDGAERCS